MKFKTLLAAMLLAGAAMPALAQTHVEGVEYYKADQLNNARELLERNFNNAGTDKAVADYYLGLIALRDNKPTEAAALFEKGKNENPEYGFNYVGLGELKLREGDVKEAEKLFKEGESNAKKDVAMQIAIARAYYNVDPVAYEKQIAKRLESARRINMKAPEIYIFEGDRYADTKDWGNAAAQYDMAADFNPLATEAYVKYADLFTNVNPRYAITMLKKLLSNVPDSALGQRELAMAYYNDEDYANAAAEYGKYVKNPNHFKQDEDRYAFLLFYGGKYQEGYDYATQLLSKDPSHFTARRYQFMNAAQLPALKEQLLPMAEQLYTAHLSDKKNTFAPIDFILISDEFNKGGKSDEAVAVLNEAMKEYPENGSFNKQLAMLCVDRNEFAAASDAFNGYLEKTAEPGYNDYIQAGLFAYYGAIESKEDAAKADRLFNLALADAEKASELLPDNYRPYKMRGDVAIQRAAKENISSAAVADYTKAAELLEGKVEARYANDAKAIYNYLGNHYLDVKDVPTAKTWFLKVVELDPDNTEYRNFVENLK